MRLARFAPAFVASAALVLGTRVAMLAHPSFAWGWPPSWPLLLAEDVLPGAALLLLCVAVIGASVAASNARAWAGH